MMGVRNFELLRPLGSSPFPKKSMEALKALLALSQRAQEPTYRVGRTQLSCT